LASKIFVEVIGNASQFKKELSGAVASTNKANSGFARMGKIAGLAGGALVTGLAFGLEKSIHAAIDAEASTARLEQAFKNAGLSSAAYSKQIEGAEAASRKLGFTDEDVKNSLGSLLSATKNVGLSIKDMSVAEDLARFKHLDLEQATKMLTMAMTGSQRAVKQLGITISPVTSAVDALKRSNMDLSTAAGHAALAHAKLVDKMATGQAVIAATSGLVKGQGEAFAGSAAGGMAQFHAQIQHLEVAVGEQLLPALTKLLDKAVEFTTYLNTNLGPAVKEISDKLDKFRGAAELVKWIMEHSLSIFVLVRFELKALALAIDAGSFAFDKLKGAASAVGGFFTGVFQGAVSTVHGAVSGLEGAVRAVSGAFSSALGAVSGLAGFLRGGLVGAFNVAKGVASGVVHVVNAIAAAFWAAEHAVQALINAINSIPTPHLPHLPHIGNPFKAAGGPVFAGGSYIVGEQGPEMFSPGRSGYITPNHALGGGGNVYVTVQGALLGSTVPEVAATIRSELLRTQRRNGGLGWAT
jgi:hypothetical protein